MGRTILAGFKTQEEADAYLEGLKDGMSKIMVGINESDLFVLDDTDYNGQWTVNLD